MSYPTMRRLIAISALLALLGCREQRDPEFRALVQKAMKDLMTKNESHHSDWGLSRAENWNLNLDDGRLVFTFPDKVVTCDAQVVGSFDTSTETWLWSWEDPTVRSNLTVVSRQLREYGKEHDYKKLTEATWKATEEDAWDMTAVATLQGNAQGAYRGRGGHTFVFMTFGKPKIEKRQNAPAGASASGSSTPEAVTNATSPAGTTHP